MNTDKIVLNGLKLEEYIHPIEQKVKFDNDSLPGKELDFLADLNLSTVKRITLGCNIEVTDKNYPDLYSIMINVCRILDYKHMPRLFVEHSASQNMYCAGGKNTQITLSDYVVEHFTTDMLYYTFGNLISMMKAGNIRLATICSMMNKLSQTALLELPIKSIMRAADLTSDRGGLLACQSIGDAIRCILWEAGIPIKDMIHKDDNELINLAKKYIHAVETISEDWFTGLSKNWAKINMTIMPPAYRIRELVTWYENGEYKRILNFHSKKNYLE